MSLSLAIDSSPPWFVQQYTQTTKNDKGATYSTACGRMSAVSLRKGVWDTTNDVVVVSGYRNSALRVDVNTTAEQSRLGVSHPEFTRGLSNVKNLDHGFGLSIVIEKKLSEP